MNMSKDGKPKFRVGTQAFNWIKSSPTNSVEGSLAKGSKEDPFVLAFETQTSTISSFYSPMTNMYDIVLHHRGKKHRLTVAAEAVHSLENLDYVLGHVKQMFLYEVSMEDEEVIHQLFDNFFGTGSYAVGGWIQQPLTYPGLSIGQDTSYQLETKSRELPGVNEQVKHPVTGDYTTLARTIINLNDKHKWTREEIADWIETLDVDTTFPVEYTEPNKEVV
jgi:hypothetical protein